MKEYILNKLCFTDKHIDKLKQFIKDFELEYNTRDLDSAIDNIGWNTDLFDAITEILFIKLRGKLEARFDVNNFDDELLKYQCENNSSKIEINITYNWYSVKNWNDLVNIIEKLYKLEKVETEVEVINTNKKGKVVAHEHGVFTIQIDNKLYFIDENEVIN